MGSVLSEPAAERMCQRVLPGLDRSHADKSVRCRSNGLSQEGNKVSAAHLGHRHSQPLISSESFRPTGGGAKQSGETTHWSQNQNQNPADDVIIQTGRDHQDQNQFNLGLPVQVCQRLWIHHCPAPSTGPVQRLLLLRPGRHPQRLPTAK